MQSAKSQTFAKMTSSETLTIVTQYRYRRKWMVNRVAAWHKRHLLTPAAGSTIGFRIVPSELATKRVRAAIVLLQRPFRIDPGASSESSRQKNPGPDHGTGSPLSTSTSSSSMICSKLSMKPLTHATLSIRFVVALYSVRRTQPSPVLPSPSNRATLSRIDTSIQAVDWSCCIGRYCEKKVRIFSVGELCVDLEEAPKGTEAQDSAWGRHCPGYGSVVCSRRCRDIQIAVQGARLGRNCKGHSIST